MSIFPLFKKNKESQTDMKSNFNVIISPTVLLDVTTLLNKQNKRAIRLVVSGFC